MRSVPWRERKFWLNAGLSLSVAGMPWTATISLLGTSALSTLISTPVQAATLRGWEFDPATQELLITVPGGTTPRYFLAAEPARIVLDLPNTEMGTVPMQQTYEGAVREIRIAQFEPGVVRIVLELAPGTVLAPGHVELQQMAGADETRDRWVLRPLLASNASVAMAPASPLSPVGTSSPAIPGSSPEPPASTSAPELPPLEPGATEIPVEQPPEAIPSMPTPDSTAAPPPLIGMGSVTEGGHSQSVRMPFSEATSPTIEDTPALTHPPSLPNPPVSQDRPQDEPQDRPQDRPQDTTATGDALPNQPPASIAALPALPEASPTPLPSFNPSAGNTAGVVSVPPLSADSIAPSSSPSPLTPTRPHASPPTPTPPPNQAAIEFGQPLPKSAHHSLSASPAMPASEDSIAYSSGNSSSGNYILLPSGTTLNVRYTGEAPLELTEGESRQEVLVLAEAVRDAAGNIVLPEGSYVLGRFETSEQGSQFIAQAISLEGQSLILNAQSQPLSGQHPSQSSLLRNSALGLAAGVALGITGIGLIPAIAAGAATTAGITFLPNSRSNVVQPDQVLEVQLTQDLMRVN